MNPNLRSTLTTVSGSIIMLGMFGAPANALECRLSVVLDRTGSMGSGSDSGDKCAIALDYAIGAIEGYRAGNNVVITPDDVGNPDMIADYYTQPGRDCDPAERRVQVVTVSDPVNDIVGEPVALTGWVSPTAAIALLNDLQNTDLAGVSNCGGATQLADALCVAADSLRAEAPSTPDFFRHMKIVTDGGENSSFFENPVTVCEGATEDDWLHNTDTELRASFLKPPIVFDVMAFEDGFLYRSISGKEAEGKGGGNNRLSPAELNFLFNLALNTGGTALFVDALDDVADAFESPGGITCRSDLDQDLDVDNTDALVFQEDFNNSACQLGN